MKQFHEPLSMRGRLYVMPIPAEQENQPSSPTDRDPNKIVKTNQGAQPYVCTRI
jgi:hypothetical protein